MVDDVLGRAARACSDLQDAEFAGSDIHFGQGLFQDFAEDDRAGADQRPILVDVVEVCFVFLVGEDQLQRVFFARQTGGELRSGDFDQLVDIGVLKVHRDYFLENILGECRVDGSIYSDQAVRSDRYEFTILENPVQLAFESLVPGKMLDFRYLCAGFQGFHVTPKGCVTIHDVCQNKPSLGRVDLAPEVGGFGLYYNVVVVVLYLLERLMRGRDRRPAW